MERLKLLGFAHQGKRLDPPVPLGYLYVDDQNHVVVDVQDPQLKADLERELQAKIAADAVCLYWTEVSNGGDTRTRLRKRVHPGDKEFLSALGRVLSETQTFGEYKVDSLWESTGSAPQQPIAH